MRTIAVVNQKGGCGKTTTVVNLAASFAIMGKRVLLVDLDSQGHTTLAVGGSLDAHEGNIYDILSNEQIATSDNIVGTNIEGVDLVPSHIRLSGLDVELATKSDREYILKNALNNLQERYDICMIDCSPSLNIATLNALAACGEVIIPVQAHYLAIEGLKQLLDTFVFVKNNHNPDIKVLGILITMADTRTKLYQEICQQLKDLLGDLIFEVVIHKNIRLTEAPSAGESILTYAPKSRGAIDHLALAREILRSEAEVRNTQEHCLNT